MKTSELIGPALDWAVAKCEGYTDLRMNPHRYAAFLIMTPPRAEYGPVQLADLDYSTNWELSGPIIDREKISLLRYGDSFTTTWTALAYCDAHYIDLCAGDGSGSEGPTALVAAMRAYVSSRLGDNVDVPEALC